jgi:cell division protein FtsQ
VRPIGTGSGNGSAAGESPDAGGIVLPRILRRPVRILSRADWSLPRHAGKKAVALLFLATALAGITLGGHGATVVSALASWSGLGIESVKITGQSETSEVDILDRLDMGPFPSIVTFDVDKARANIEALPWVSQVGIRKLYPDTVEIAVSERAPYAIWQRGPMLSLIDREGKVIANNVGERYAKLPLVVGEGAGPRVAEFTDLLAGYPSLQPLVKAGVLVSERRWNVVLGNGVEILLPEANPGDALDTVARFEASDRLLDRDIAAIDLRTDGRLVVRLSEGAMKARQDMLKERDKLLKKKASNT